MTLTHALAGLAILTAGYLIGRYRPAHRTSDWAHWQRYGPRPTGLRNAAVWTVLSAENIGWLITHPRQGRHAWKRHNDPPPRRSPAVRINTRDDQET
ncbi:hypothetical protein [Streptomyces sp. MBT28]|uniref:hypothetical protein n=1 Tax=Streptomyces sp. MBT28 TaxID=1488357 RepID=UPI000619368E|nr:hypothetical protein [Streptomyces sp. MBT28]